MAESDIVLRNTVTTRVGNWLFRWRNLVFPVTFLALLVVGRPRYPGGSTDADVLMDVTGVLVALAGQIVRVAVIGLVYIHRGGKDGRVYADDLVTEGIFAHSRNPLYFGNILVFAGLIVILNSWPGWLVALPAVLYAYYAIIRAEEAFLTREFGQRYREYCQRVNRIVPAPRGLGATLRAHRFDWRRVVRMEYGSTFTWTTAVIVLLVWERVANGEGAAVRNDWPAYAAGWGVIVVLYVIARLLKKTTRVLAS